MKFYFKISLLSKVIYLCSFICITNIFSANKKYDPWNSDSQRRQVDWSMSDLERRICTDSQKVELREGDDTGFLNDCDLNIKGLISEFGKLESRSTLKATSEVFEPRSKQQCAEVPRPKE